MVKWSDKALSDLYLISEIIENNFSNEVADKVIDGLLEFVETQLAQNREIGISFEIAPHYRYLVYKGNKVFYTPYEQEGVEYVVHIVARTSEFSLENLNTD